MSKKCVLCGKKFEGWGNNALPLKEGQCCDYCNDIKVIPARLNKLFSKATGGK